MNAVFIGKTFSNTYSLLAASAFLTRLLRFLLLYKTAEVVLSKATHLF